MSLVPTAIGAVLIAFLLMHMVPGDPAELLLAGYPDWTLEDYELLRKMMGLDKPLHIQFLIYMSRLVRGDWGKSIYGHLPILPLLIERFRNTLELTIFSILLSSSIGLTMGLIAALKRGTFIDGFFRTISLAGYSMPSFWLGLLLMLVFSLHLDLLPPLGRGSLAHMIMPSMVLATYGASTIGRMTRACILEIMTEDFVLTAKAKGMSRGRILLKHVFPNALIPIVTIIGLQLGYMLGGAIVTETVFAYPGIGWLTVYGIQRRDYPMVQGCILYISIVFVLINYAMDIIYAYVDPRVRY